MNGNSQTAHLFGTLYCLALFFLLPAQLLLASEYDQEDPLEDGNHSAMGTDRVGKGSTSPRLASRQDGLPMGGRLTLLWWCPRDPAVTRQPSSHNWSVSSSK